MIERQIKFIAWDTDAKRLIDWQELLDYGSGLAEYLRNHRELIFLQFTEHHDQLGNELYHGHIVTAGDNYPSVVDWDNQEGRWELVEYYPRRGKYATKDDRYHELTSYTDGLGVIIGHIYTTPQLLRTLRRS